MFALPSAIGVLMTDDRARLLALVVVHSSGKFRTNRVVRNFEPWYEAFGVTENDKLDLPKQDRISILKLLRASLE